MSKHINTRWNPSLCIIVPVYPTVAFHDIICSVKYLAIDLLPPLQTRAVTSIKSSFTVVVLTCFLTCVCVYVCVCVCVCGWVGFVTCSCFDSCVSVLVICVLVFAAFCIVCTVFLYCFVYV